MSDCVRRAEIVIAGAALVAGAFGLLFARDLAFMTNSGARIGSLFSLNPFGAVLTIALSLVAFAGAVWRARSVVMASGVGFALAALVQLVQSGASTNWLGGRPSTFSLFLAAAVGLVVLGVATRAYEAGGDQP